MREISATLSIILLFSLCTYILLNRTKQNIKEVMLPESEAEFTVILDAGHGGEDGGAVAFDGTLEKDINLVIAKNIALYFDIFGIKYIMTRTGDCALGDTDLKTVRERKRSDIETRFALVNNTPDSYLLSIHQNKFSVEKYNGTQVFYSDRSDEAKNWAYYIQTAVVSALQPENKRKIKTADRDIFLLKNAKRPSIIVECGFLSNFEELEKLKDKKYTSALAYCICGGSLKYFNSRE